MKIPEDIEGVTRLGLWLPDVAESLRSDSRYAYRFANQDCWDEKNGVNWVLRKKSE